MVEIDRWLSQLEEKGGRITGPRRAIVELLATSDRALSPIEIFDLARISYPKMGLVTVYRTLELLEELHLIERVHQESGCHMFLRAACGHQHIVLCMKCGRAVYFNGEDLSQLFQRISRESGFVIESHWLQLQGLCKSCQTKRG